MKTANKFEPNYSDMKNKKMNDKTYQERRVVMDLIYKAKNLLKEEGIDLPRITIRITEETGEVCGLAQMGGNVVWIPSNWLGKSYLYQVVLHELCHAVWAIDHDQKCALMHTHVQPLSEKSAEQIFLSYARKNTSQI